MKMTVRSCAPFSFHCVICFDAFNLDDRPPVVLPCGHTYICAPCSKRLKKCMECRTDLFLTPPPPPRAAQQQQAAARNRNSTCRYQQSAPAGSPSRPVPSKQCPSVEPIALPLPKNLVMMTLMEASMRTAKAEKLAAAAVAARDRICSETVNSYSDTDDDDAYASGDDDEKVLTGISVMASLCGTYAVRDPEGLIILPDNPNKSMSHSPSKNSSQSLQEIFKRSWSPLDERIASVLTNERCYSNPLPSLPEEPAIDMSALANTELQDREELTVVSRSSEDDEMAKAPVPSGFDENRRDDSPFEHSFSVAPKLKVETLCQEEMVSKTEQVHLQTTFSKDEREETAILPSRRPIKLEFGQKVQIVDVKAGVAKLARGTGYIVASSAQLVKVGGPLDNACHIEGAITSLESTKADLLRKLQDIERTEGRLYKDLDEALSMPPAHPLIQPVSHPSDPKITGPKNHISFSSSRDTSSPVTVQLHGVEGISSPRSASPVSPPSLVGRGSCSSLRHVGFSSSIDDSPLIEYDRRNAVQLSDADRVSLRTPHVSILESDDTDYSTGSRLICGSSFLSNCEHDENTTSAEGSIEMNYEEPSQTTSMSLFQMEKIRSQNSLGVERVYMDMIDFRTGLSGHLALNSTRSHADRRTPIRAVRMMSEHKGIASIRPVRQLNNYGPPGLAKSPKRLASKKTW